MNRDIFLAIVTTFAEIVLLLLFEQLICYIVIKMKKQLTDFNDYKAKNRSLFSASKFLYNNKAIWIVVKVIFIIIIIIPSFLSKDSQTYYDMYGNRYQSKYDVLYYDKDGNSYTRKKSERYLFDASGNETELYTLNENGFIVDTSKMNLYCGPYLDVFYTKSGEYYFDFDAIYWNENGRMFYNDAKRSFPVDESSEHIEIIIKN